MLQNSCVGKTSDVNYNLKDNILGRGLHNVGCLANIYIFMNRQCLVLVRQM